MPRQARVDLPGLLHHVMARGIEGRVLFSDPADYSDFQARLEASNERYPSQILAWALMPNHFHLLIRSGKQGIVPFMQKVMTGYATSYNIRHQRSGHLFGNRYKSIICEEETYLLELVRYIHLNPLRAKIVEDMKELADFPFCGHGALLGKRSHAWQEIDDVLARFSSNPSKARTQYESFVEEGNRQGKRSDLTGGGLIRSMGGVRNVMQSGRSGEREAYDSRVLGSGQFVQDIMKAVEIKETVQDRLRKKGVTLDQVAERVAQEFGLSKSLLFQRDRTALASKAKALFIHIRVEYLGQTNREVSLMTKMGDVAATRARLRGSALLSTSGLGSWLEVN
ncbi:MAG: transposase [Elusimicrobia bacterium]|nr:transposase [Elusimicrobiota bacterium]